MALLGVALLLVCVGVAPFAPTRASGQAANPTQPQRILSLCTSATDTLLRLGATNHLAGIDEYSRIVPGATNLPVLGKGSAISKEEILVRRIDLAFVWWFQDDAARMLADLGVSVVRMRCDRASDVPDTIRQVGHCAGLTNQADRLAQTFAAALQSLRQTPSAGAPGVYLELYSPLKTAGRGSYLNDLIVLAGGRNIAADASGPILLSTEHLIQADPELVLLLEGFATPDSFARRNGMSALAAVKAGRVHTIDRYWLVPGAGLPDAVAHLRTIVAGTSRAER